MKRKAVIAAAAVMCCITAVSAGGYGTYCENIAAVKADSVKAAELKAAGELFGQLMQQTEQEPATAESGTAEAPAEPEITAAEVYSQRLELFSGFMSGLSQSEVQLAEKLTEHDLLLNKVKLAASRYSEVKDEAERLAEQYRTGGCDKASADEAEKQRSEKYYELQSLLFDVSALQTEISTATGEKLTADFDSSQAYLLTDILQISAEELSGFTFGTICAADGAEISTEAADVTAQYNAAVQGYYSLGEKLRAYVSAAEEYKKAQSGFKLGSVDKAQLDSKQSEFEDARLDALEGKAEYSALLLSLDSASGGILTRSQPASAGIVDTLRAALPESGAGKGLWLVRRKGGEVQLEVKSYPFSFDAEKDSVKIEISYGGKTLCSAPAGAVCSFAEPEYISGEDSAVLTAYKNGKTAGSWRIDVFSPFGGFLEVNND